MSAGHGAAWRRRERQLRAWHRHERMTVAMELATALHHSAQRVEAPREGVEGETNDALRRPKPPLPGKRPAPLEQAKLGQHSGIGYELVLALDVPVLQMVEQPVDASALAFLEEEEAKALNAEFSMLARSATSHTVRLREVMMRMHVLRQKGRGRKKKKRRKKKLPKASSSRSSCASHAARTRISGRSSTCPFFLAVLFGVMVLPEEYFGAFPYSAIPWFYYGYSSCVSRWFHIFPCEGGPRLQRSFLAATCPDGCLQARDALHHGRYGPEGQLFGESLAVACTMLVLLVFLHLALYSSCCSQAHDASHHGRYGPEGQLFGESLAVACTMLPSRCVPFFVFRPKMPVFMAGMDTGAVLGQGFLHARCCVTCCATVQTVQYTVWRFRSYSSSRSSHPRRGAEGFPMFSRPLRFHCCRFDVSVVQDRQVRLVQAWRIQPCPTLPWRTRLRSHSCSSSTLVYVQDWQVPQVQSWKRQLYSHSFGLLVLGLGVQASRFHRCSLRGDSRYPTVAASRRICSALTRWSMSRLWFACLLLLNNRCRHSRWVFFGPCTQVHGQGFPRHQGGEGVAGTPGACSQVFCHPN